jgi:hypothetical protein
MRISAEFLSTSKLSEWATYELEEKQYVETFDTTYLCNLGENRIKRRLSVLLMLLSATHAEQALNDLKRMLSILLLILGTCLECN